jgi:CheY-like chemotaxis protein
VIINLAQNAARFTTNGFVSIGCSYACKEDRGTAGDEADRDGACASARRAGLLTILVRDTGSGLSDKMKETLLTSIQPSSGVNVGCGIGLFLAQKLLASMGSTLTFRSPWTEQSSGTEFMFTLEVQEGDAPQADRTLESSNAEALRLPQTLHLLIADDQTMNRKLLLRALKKCIHTPIECTEVSTAEDAIEAAAKRRFDLIFMDENFSVEDDALLGTDAIRAIRKAERGPKAPVIVSCSGYASNDNEATFKQAGSDAVWGKPLPSHVDGSMQREVANLLRWTSMVS